MKIEKQNFRGQSDQKALFSFFMPGDPLFPNPLASDLKSAKLPGVLYFNRCLLRFDLNSNDMDEGFKTISHLIKQCTTRATPPAFPFNRTMLMKIELQSLVSNG